MKYSITNDTVTAIVDGEIHIVHMEVDSEKFTALKKALFEEDVDAVRAVVSPGHAVLVWSDGDFEAVDGIINYQGEPLPPELNERLIDMVQEKVDYKVLTNFWTRLQNNPSMRSVQQLFRFLAQSGIPLTNDGYILSYKSVTVDYKDHHTRRVDNTVGVVNEMPRNKISDDPNTACHYGYHVGALEYARTFGGSGSVIVICKVDPADVVCVPYDHSSQKVRVCKYEVVGVWGDARYHMPSTVFSIDGVKALEGKAFGTEIKDNGDGTTSITAIADPSYGYGSSYDYDDDDYDDDDDEY